MLGHKTHAVQARNKVRIIPTQRYRKPFHNWLPQLWPDKRSEAKMTWSGSAEIAQSLTFPNWLWAKLNEFNTALWLLLLTYYQKGQDQNILTPHNFQWGKTGMYYSTLLSSLFFKALIVLLDKLARCPATKEYKKINSFIFKWNGFNIINQE